jgi:hypothetical protein
MAHEFDPCEAPTDAKLDKWGFTIRPTITEDELILLCLKNAPCGTDRKQVMSIVKKYEEKLGHGI